MKHRRRPLEWDKNGEWDGVVVFIDGEFVRYLDRNGETRVSVVGDERVT